MGLMVVIACYTNAQTLCNVTYSGLLDCKPAVTPPNPPPPTAECCDAASHADLKCFCQYKNSTLWAGYGVDPKLVLQIPEKCKLPHPAPC